VESRARKLLAGSDRDPDASGTVMIDTSREQCRDDLRVMCADGEKVVDTVHIGEPGGDGLIERARRRRAGKDPDRRLICIKAGGGDPGEWTRTSLLDLGPGPDRPGRFLSAPGVPPRRASR
jgi:hypothetical protein